MERSSPGLALLFEGLTPDGRHTILDLGLASASRLEVLGPFARQIRFAGLVPPSPNGADTPLVHSIPDARDPPFDVVLAWDVLDHLGASDGDALIRRLDAVTAPGAVLYAVVRDGAGAPGLATTMDLMARDRVLHQPAAAERPIDASERRQGALLPAQVEKRLAPFQLVRAISLRIGLREYVARKGP